VTECEVVWCETWGGQRAGTRAHMFSDGVLTPAVFGA